MCPGPQGQKTQIPRERPKWPIGRTPPEVNEKYDAEIKALEAAPSADSSDNDGDGDGGDGRVGPKEGITALGPRRRSPRVPCLHTLPQSTDDPPPKPRGRKRRRKTKRERIDTERFVCAREDFAAKNDAAHLEHL